MRKEDRDAGPRKAGTDTIFKLPKVAKSGDRHAFFKLPKVAKSGDRHAFFKLPKKASQSPFFADAGAALCVMRSRIDE